MMIQSNSDQIRTLIDQALRNAGRASLVNLIGTFDARNHLIPTVTEINDAISKLGFQVSISQDSLYLEKSDSLVNDIPITDSALSLAFASYVSQLQTLQQK